MRKLLIVSLAVAVAACDMPTELPPTTTAMTVVSKSDYSRRFTIVLRDPKTGATFDVRPGRGKRKRCPNGPERVQVGETMRVVVNNYRYDDGRTTYEVDRYALRDRIC